MPKRVFISLVLVLILGLLLFNTRATKAALTGCGVTVDKQSLDTNVSDTLTFDIVNNDEASNLLKWVKISAPSTNFVITSADAPYLANIDLAANGSEVTIRLGGLSSGEHGSFVIGVNTGTTGVSAGGFVVTTSDDFDNGTDPITCSGETSVSIVAPPGAPISISNAVASVTSTTASFSWTTNVAGTGKVEYGSTSSYGSSSSTTSSGTSHSVSISGLSASTTYHFRVVSTSSGDGTVAQTNDNTFTTATSGTNTETTVTVTTTKTETKTVEKLIEDKIVPTATISSNLGIVYKISPRIIGKAQDNIGISKVDYSIDGGKNWLPVDEIDKPFAKIVNFNFLPFGLLDGNYPIKIRATDPTGNVGFSLEQTLIIDRLPPRVGLSMWSVGPLVIDPVFLEGTTAKISLSAVGGPNEIVLKSKSGINTTLDHDTDTGLWSGTVRFDDVGDFLLETNAVDGANNRVVGNLGSVKILPSGHLPRNGTLTVYYFEPTSAQFQIWDGSPFEQNNPVKVDSKGKYRLMLPPGKYYLQASALGYREMRTNIFTLSETTIVNMDFDLKKGVAWWPWEQIDTIDWTAPKLNISLTEKMVGQLLPFFALPSDSKQLVYNTAFRGQPSLLTFISTWVPVASEQLSVLDKLSKGSNLKISAVFSQQPQSIVEIFKKRGGYGLQMISDVDGDLLGSLGIGNVPTHVFVDRSGKIQKIQKGVLNEEEIQTIISNF